MKTSENLTNLERKLNIQQISDTQDKMLLDLNEKRNRDSTYCSIENNLLVVSLAEDERIRRISDNCGEIVREDHGTTRLMIEDERNRRIMDTLELIDKVVTPKSSSARDLYLSELHASAEVSNNEEVRARLENRELVKVLVDAEQVCFYIYF